MNAPNFADMTKAAIAEWSGGQISTALTKDEMVAAAEAMVAAAQAEEPPAAEPEPKTKAPRKSSGPLMVRVTAAADNPVKVHVNGRLAALLPHGKWVKVPAVALPSLDAAGVRYDTRQ